LVVSYILPGRKYVGRDVRVDFVKRMQERLNANGAIVAAEHELGAPRVRWVATPVGQ
jgi:hypothetical protein